jgi:hypothetical protein
MAKGKTATQSEVTILPPNFQTAVFRIVGTAPYVQHKFSQKARELMRGKQEAGSAGKKGKKREPKDFMACYEGAKHKSADGWCGIPAPAFRCAMVSACRIVGFKMTLAKLALFIEADGLDSEDGTPLVRITKGEPQYHESAVRNESGVCDLRARPMWMPGWQAAVRIRFDADLFSVEDLANLLMRVGQQVGVGEGRPDSTNSCGMGWGTFSILEEKEAGQ